MQIHELNNFNGTPGATNFLAIDDGSDTSRISGEALLDPVNSRIDNLTANVLPDSVETILDWADVESASKTLTKNVSGFDYLDLYFKEVTSGTNRIVFAQRYPRTAFPAQVTIPVISWGGGTDPKYLYFQDLMIAISGTTLTMSQLRIYSWDGKAADGANIETGILVDQIRVDGVKISSNTSAELTDLRTAHNGTVYASARAAREADYNALDSEIGETNTKINDLDSEINGAITYNYLRNKNLYVYGVNHSIVDDPNACVSEMIPMTWDASTRNGFWYTDDTSDSNNYYIFFYDSSKNYLGFRGKDPGTLGRNVYGYNGTAYVQFSFKKGFIGAIKNAGQTETYWIAEEMPGIVKRIGNVNDLDTTSKDNLVAAINEMLGDIPELPIKPRDTSFFYTSKNIIDPSLNISGEYVNQVSGAFAANSSYTRTGYVEVNGGAMYLLKSSAADKSTFRYAFYDENKTYISGELTASEYYHIITAPQNAKYIACSSTNRFFPIMLAESTTDLAFEDYELAYILPEYIPGYDTDDVLINVPSKIYALVGFETNIYFENITEDWSKYSWDVTCAKGMQLERGFRITPGLSDVGSYEIKIKATAGKLSKEITATLIITSASAGSGETASVIVLGDSTTYNGIVIGKIHEDFEGDVMNVQTIGTMGTAPNKHEGRSGWSWADYFTKASITYPEGDSRGTIYNPFYNPSTQTFDATYYFANSGIAKPDFFIINMGINDVFGYASDAELESAMPTILQRCEDAVQSVLDATTTTKVCVCLTIPPNHSQDAFGKAYGCAQTRDRCKRNNTLWVKALIEQFANRESERIYIIPINACLDTVYNMGMQTMPVNARNTEMTYESPVANGGVHPVASGYWQIADVYTAFIKAQA